MYYCRVKFSTDVLSDSAREGEAAVEKNLEREENFDVGEIKWRKKKKIPESTYVVLLASAAHKSRMTRKRSSSSVGSEEAGVKKNSSIAETSAKNFEALKITDDMFKGGLEQSNPLGEDNPLLLGLPAILSNVSVTPRSFGTPRTTTEWKIIKVTEKKKREPRFGRHLTQIVKSELEANVSSLISSSSTEIANFTNFTTQRSNSNESISTSNNTQPENIEITTIAQKTNVSDFDGRIISMENDGKMLNQTRLRRHARNYFPKNLPKHRSHRVHRLNRNERFRNNLFERKRQSGNTGGNNQKGLSVLLAADNIEDESQIDQAVHGELAGKIVEKIFQEVQQNDALKVAFGPGLYRNHKPQESMALDKMYQQGLNEKEVKETEALMKRVMELLGRLVLDEVRRKTCAPLTPDMRDFLQWTLGLEDFAGPLSDQVPPLPTIPGHEEHETTPKESAPKDKFLFPNATDGRTGELRELERKVNILKGLIKEYNALTEREKTQVQTVHDYLVRQLSLLIKYIETKEAAEKSKMAGAIMSPQQILQYQAAMPNINHTTRRADSTKFGKKSSNYRQEAYSIFKARPVDLSQFKDSRVYEKRSAWPNSESGESSMGDIIWESRAGRSGKNDDEETSESMEYRKLLRQIASLRRKKRADPFDYEEPKIYFLSNEEQQYSNPLSNLSSNFSLDRDSHLRNNSSLPIRGNNRIEDEVLLLNKREAWKKENELMLEEVAFGKDTRNDFSNVPPQYSDEENDRLKRDKFKNKPGIKDDLNCGTKITKKKQKMIKKGTAKKPQAAMKAIQPKTKSKATDNDAKCDKSKYYKHRKTRSIDNINVFPVDVPTSSTSIY